MDKIALVGLGAMGIGMARNMLKSGLAVTGIDISAERRALFVEDGGNVAESLQDLAGTLDAVFVMVNEAEHMEAALFTNGAASRMRRG
ncbi:MAG: 3-hydroxyisobutyrate dehydrogenase, partial [Spirochaetae bacterium HGW-Spirochaetae-4]